MSLSWRRDEDFDVDRLLYNIMAKSPEAAELFRYLIALLNSVSGRLDAIDEKLSDVDARVGAVEEGVAGLGKRLDAVFHSVSGRLDAIDEKLSDVDARVGAVEEGVAGLGKRLDAVEYKLGGLAEASFSRLALRELERAGYQILDYRRNVTVGGGETRREIDLIVHARKGGEEYTIAVEVKTRPDLSDVGRLLGLAEMLRDTGLARGRLVPVLTGVWISERVEAYARRKDVEILRL